MELFIPHTPLAIVITAFLTIVVCLKIIKDVKEIRSSRQAHSLIMNFVKKKNIPRIAVVIELRKTADTIMPLLDHLYEQNYKGLEIVVVVKHTAGKYAQSKLMYYRRKHQRKDLKIVKHTKGLDIKALIHRYVSSPFVMQLMPQNTLSDDFFSKLAIDLLNERVDAIIPRTHVSTGKTVASAVGAVLSVWQHVFASFHTPKLTQNSLVVGRVYRRTVLFEGPRLITVYAPRISVRRVAETTWKALIRSAVVAVREKLHSRRARIATVFVIILTAGLGAYIWSEDTRLFAVLAIALYSIVYGLSLLALKGYSFSERINLLLFAPFGLFFGALLGIYAFAAAIYSLSGLGKFRLRAFALRGKRRSLAIPKL